MDSHTDHSHLPAVHPVVGVVHCHLYEGVRLQLEVANKCFPELLEASEVEVHAVSVLLECEPGRLNAAVHNIVKVKGEFTWFQQVPYCRWSLGQNQ